MSADITRQQPKKGRYFPLTPGQARRAAKVAGLVDWHGKRVPIAHFNPDDDDRDDFLLATLHPADELWLFSVPDGTDPAIMAAICTFAVEQLGRHGQERTGLLGGESLIYRVVAKPQSQGV